MNEVSKILVAYYSATGSVKVMAEAAAEGAGSVEGTKVALRAVEAVTRDDLLSADGIVIGTPVYFGNMAAPVKQFVDEWGFLEGTFLEDRVGGAFAVGSVEAGGRENAVVSLLVAMVSNGMIVTGPIREVGEIRYGQIGATAVGGGPDGLEDACALGRRVARLARILTSESAARRLA